MRKRSVAVIGAGVAGLAAALRLVRSGCAVTLYERSERAGGVMRSDMLEGVAVDCGVQLLSSTYRTFVRVTRDIGVGDRLVRTPGRDALWRRGRAHPLVYGSAASLATSAALPALLKLKVASKYLPFLAGRCRGLDANDMVGTGGLRHDGESIAAWGAAELGRSFVEWMAYPFLGAYYGAEPEKTSATFFHALARIGFDVKLYGLSGGMGVFAMAAIATLREAGADVQFGAEVSALRRDDGGVSVTAGAERGYDGAVVAVPAQECRRLMRGTGELDAWLAEVRTAPSTLLALVLSKPIRTGYFGAAIPRTEPEGKDLVAACFQSQKVEGLVPADREVIVAFPAPAVAAEMGNAAPAQVVDRLLPALESMYGGLEDSVLAAKVYRHTSGHTQVYPGYVRHLARFDEAMVPDRVAIAGDWTVAPTVEGAAVSGERAAFDLTRRLR